MSQHSPDLLINMYHFIPIDFIPKSHVKISGRNYWYARFYRNY